MSHEMPKRRDDLLVHDLGAETIVYDADGKTVHVLNVSGQLIWRLCDGEQTVATIVRAVCANFAGVEEADVEADVVETLKVLRQKQLIV